MNRHRDSRKQKGSVSVSSSRGLNSGQQAFGALLLMLFLLITGHSAFAIQKILPDPQATVLVNQLMRALSIQDPQTRLAAVLPLVHVSLRTADQSDLTSNNKDFSYKKACDNVKFYQIPVTVKEVHKGNELTIGFQKTAERGRIDKYFVKKRPGVQGLPAPIQVFMPLSGRPPRIYGMGSL